MDNNIDEALEGSRHSRNPFKGPHYLDGVEVIYDPYTDEVRDA